MTLSAREQSQLIGHEKVEQNILRSWQQNRLPHSILLTGPQGVGRATLAYRLAKFLLSNPDKDANSLSVPTDDPIARRVTSGGHGDLLVIEPDPEKATKEISVDQVRKAKGFLAQTPLEGGWRIVIVDGEMNGSSANAILKMLEEPPKKTLLILMTQSAGRVLPTIRSRCTLINLRPLKQEQVKQLIQDQNPDLTTSQVNLITALCDGCPGLVDKYKDPLLIDLYKDLLDLLTNLSPFNYGQALEFSQRYNSTKSDSVDTFRAVGDYLRRFIHKLTRYAIIQEGEGSLPEEIKAFQHALSIRPAPQWSKTWQDINKSFQEAQRFHLDKTQVIFSNICLLAGVNK